MNEKDAIDLHLYLHPPINGVQYKSSLIALLGDARGAAERYGDNDEGPAGHVKPGHLSTSWLAATGYLILLEQIGKCFKRKGRDVQDTSFVAKALRGFSTVQDDAIVHAIWALRNALAHDYSLFNGNTKDDRFQHAFAFRADVVSPLVEPPAVRWDGVYDRNTIPPVEHATCVNLRRLGDVVEGVVSKLRELHAANDLEIRPPMTVDEFHIRYGLYYPDDLSSPVDRDGP